MEMSVAAIGFSGLDLRAMPRALKSSRRRNLVEVCVDELGGYGKVAQMFGVDFDTVQRWCDNPRSLTDGYLFTIKLAQLGGMKPELLIPKAGVIGGAGGKGDQGGGRRTAAKRSARSRKQT